MFIEENEYEEYGQTLRKKATQKAKQDFIQGCYDAYDLLVSAGESALHGTDEKDIRNAINRMTSFFILSEEYERCEFLKNFVRRYMPGFEISPDTSIQQELSI